MTVHVSPEPLVRLSAMTKRFGDVLAVDDVSLDLMSGSVHALLGENGAGKSVLMSLLYGVHSADSGRISIDGTPVAIRRPADAIAAGIAMVHQHFKLVPRFTVAENLMMIQHSRIGFFPDRNLIANQIRSIGVEYELEVEPDARVEDLSLGSRQRAEIVGGLARNARVLILDEPTSILSPAEVTGLFAALRKIASEGRAVVLVTHRLSEVFEVGDFFSVMRKGRLIATDPTDGSSPAHVADLMMGDNPVVTLARDDVAVNQPDRCVLRVRNLSVLPSEASPGLSSLNLEVRYSEIVAVAGVDGNGQHDLVKVLAGIMPLSEGEIWLDGHDISGASRREAAQRGLAVIPEDRHAEGLVLAMTVTENLTTDRVRTSEFSRSSLWLRLGRMREFGQRMIERFSIRARSENVQVQTLSGGNQQKIVLARELSANPLLLLAAEPTRGLDISSTNYVLAQLLEARRDGRAVLLVSSDIDQILSVADRILVMYKGKIVANVGAAEIDRGLLGRYMSGLIRHG